MYSFCVFWSIFAQFFNFCSTFPQIFRFSPVFFGCVLVTTHFFLPCAPLSDSLVFLFVRRIAAERVHHLLHSDGSLIGHARMSARRLHALHGHVAIVGVVAVAIVTEYIRRAIVVSEFGGGRNALKRATCAQIRVRLILAAAVRVVLRAIVVYDVAGARSLDLVHTGGHILIGVHAVPRLYRLGVCALEFVAHALIEHFERVALAVADERVESARGIYVRSTRAHVLVVLGDQVVARLGLQVHFLAFGLVE